MNVADFERLSNKAEPIENDLSKHCEFIRSATVVFNENPEAWLAALPYK
jgi:hypothetical protein